MFKFDVFSRLRRTRPSTATLRDLSLMRHVVMRVDLNSGGEGDSPKRFGIRQSIQQLEDVYGPIPHPRDGGAV